MVSKKKHCDFFIKNKRGVFIGKNNFKIVNFSKKWSFFNVFLVILKNRTKNATYEIFFVKI